MKKIFSFFAIAALAIMGLSSCNGIEETQPVANDAYTLTIAGTVEDQFSENTTKGLQLVAFPDWREIAEEYIHIFENGVEGKDPKFEIKPDSYNRLAYFTATFGGAEEGEEIPIIAPTTKAGGYEYNAIIAPGTDGVYTVPAVQNFQSNVSLIDPYADFLIGKTISANSRYSETQPVNMEFTRPVALFRLAIINMPDKDEKILSITVNADKALTGQVKQENIDFANGTATFDKSNGSNSLTVKYAGGAKISTIFYSYFVACPGTVNIQNVVVKTDGGEYTYKVGKDWTFSTANFDSIAIDMAKAEGGEEPGDTRTSQDLSFGDTLEFTYDMNEGGDFEEPVLTGAKTTPEYESDNTSVATVDKASGNVTFLKAGSVVITAVAPENDEYKKGQASYTITVYKAEEQTLTFTPASVSLKLGDAFTAPSLSGNKTGVTYTSNNESVATVTTAGAVTIVGVGDATITATAAGTKDWKEASASYTIHVDPADEPTPSGSTTFYLVDALKAGEDGLIVSNGHALKNNNGAIAAIEVAPEDGEITISNDDVNSVVWAVSTAENQEYGSFSFTNNSDYVYVDGSYSSGYTLHIGAGSGVDKKYFTWAYDSAANEIKNGGANAKRYLYYGSNTFTVSSSAGSTYKASFYSKNKPAPVEKKTYVKVTSAPSNWSGVYLFVAESANVAFAYNQTNYKTSVTISDSKIVSDKLGDYELTVSESSLGGGKYEIKTTNGKYLYKYGSSDILFDTNISNNNQYYALFSGNGNVTINCQRSGGSNNYFQYSSSAFGFGTSSSATVQLYKLEGSGEDQPVEKAERNLAFSAASATVKIGATNTFPTLSGEKAGVTYSSSNTAAATVNASTGAVTLVAAGETTITAAAAEDDTYKAGNASYVLTVEAADVPAPSTGKTFKKVSAFTAGKNYVIVSGTNALKNNNGSAATYSVSGKISGDILTVAEADAASITWGATSNTSDVQCGEFSLKNGSVYIYREGNDNIFALHTPSSSTLSARYAWFYDGTSMTQKNSSYSYTYYVNYSGSWNLSTSQSSVSVYEEVEEGGDEPGPTPSDTKYYTKVTGSLPTSGEWNKVLFVYDNGNGTGYAFKGIYNGDVSGAPNGTTDQNNAFLTTEGNAVAVTITEKGIASSEAIDACTLTMGFTSDTGKHNLLINNCNGYFRMRSNGNFVIMSSAGYRMTYTVSSTGTNNVSAKRDSYYFSFNGTNFAGTTSSSAKFCIYNLAE